MEDTEKRMQKRAVPYLQGLIKRKEKELRGLRLFLFALDGLELMDTEEEEDAIFTLLFQTFN